MSIPDWRDPGDPGEGSPLVWDDGKKGDFLADYRRGIEMAKAESGPHYPVMQAILSAESYRFVEEHPRSPCCDAEWILHGYTNACSKCFLSIAAVRAKMAKGEP